MANNFFPQRNQHKNNNYNKSQPTSIPSSFMLVQQPIVNSIQNNYPTMFGAPLVPVVNESKLSASQRIKIVENDIKKEKELPKFLEDQEIMKNLPKCDLHPKISERCRKCKEIKLEIEKREEERKKRDEIKFGGTILKNDNENQIEEENTNNQHNNNTQQNQSSVVNHNLKTFKIHGDSVTCNLNSLLQNNILSCQYFKDIVNKSYNEILDEIISNAKYAEPWTIGANGIPSTLFCCLYKLMLSQLTEGQIKQMINNQDSPYLRCVGFLAIRFLCDPKSLWSWLSPYILDEQEFSPKINPKERTTIGEYVEMLLGDLDYFGTRLPRLPVQIEREIKMKLLQIPEMRKRKRSNIQNLKKFQVGSSCKAISAQDGDWHGGIIREVYGYKSARIEFFDGSKEIWSNFEKTDNKWFNHEMFLMTIQDYKEKNKNQVKFFAGEEIVDLGNIILLREDNNEDEDQEDESANLSRNKKQPNRKNSISKSSSESRSFGKRKHRKNEKKHSKKEFKSKKSHSKRSRSRSRRSDSSSRRKSSSSDEKKLSKKEKEKKILEKIIQQERSNAVAKGKDYGQRPSSYKTSLSHWTTNSRKRSKSPELKQNIVIINRKKEDVEKPLEEKKTVLSKEFIEMQNKLKEQYGNSNGKSYESYKNSTEKKDYLGPEVMKLG